MLVPGLAWAGVVWRGDFETGNISQYTRAQRVRSDRLQVVQSPVAQGRYALKATVRQGDDPINASGNRNELVYLGGEREGSEYYYRWKVMFARDFPSVRTWQLFTQWHHDGCCGSPPVEFHVNGEEIRFTVASQTPWRTKLVRGVWHDFILRVKWSSNPGVGFVELWHNGTRVLAKRRAATMYRGMGIYLKLGLYRNDRIQPVGVVYHDGFVQATRYEDVAPTRPSSQPAPETGTPSKTTPGSGTPAGSTPGAGSTPDPAEGKAPETEAPETETPGTEVAPGEGSAPSTPWENLPATDEEDALGPGETLPGCSSTGGPLWGMALLGLLGLVRRVRRR